MRTFAFVVLLVSAINANTLNTFSKLRAKRTIAQYNQVEELVGKLRRYAISTEATAAKLAIQLNEDVATIEEFFQEELESLTLQANEHVDELTSKAMELGGQGQECIQNKTSSIYEALNAVEKTNKACIKEHSKDIRMHLTRLSNYVRRVFKVCDEAFNRAKSCTDGNAADKASCLTKALLRSETKIAVHAGELFALATAAEFRVSSLSSRQDACVATSIAEARSRIAYLINDIASCVQTSSKEI